MNDPLRPSSLGEILDRTFQIYRAKFLSFAVIAALPGLAMMILSSASSSWLHFSSRVHPSNRGGMILWNFILALGAYHISSLLGLMTMPASIKLVSDLTLGRKGTILSSLRFAAMRWRTYLWIAVLKLSAQLVIPELLVAALLFGVGFAGIVTSLVTKGAGFFTLFVIAVLAAGCLLFVWLGACFSFSLPICSLEGFAGIGVLRRSYSLSKGSRFRIVFTWLMVFALALVLTGAGRLASRWLVFIFFHGQQLAPTSQHIYAGALSLIVAGGSAFAFPVYSIALTLFYYDQRIRQEGYDIERMMDAAGLNALLAPPSEAGPAPSVEAVEGRA